jgi:hypothetical protein
MKHFSIGCDYGGVGSCKSWAHIPILKNAPRLEKFSLFSFYSKDEIGLKSFRHVLETTITHCPNINKLQIDPGANPLSVAVLVRLIWSTQGTRVPYDRYTQDGPGPDPQGRLADVAFSPRYLLFGFLSVYTRSHSKDHSLFITSSENAPN